MTGQEIIQRVKTLDLPTGTYVVFGSCPMALAGIREANDVDMLVSSEIYSELKKKGWKQIVKGPKDTPLVDGIYEAHENWDFSSYSPTLQHLLSTATVADGVAFASLEEVRKWKAASTNSKFKKDVELIDKHLTQG